ncbi:uncharacterized protein PHALS_09071 [Plasmopara halstedii]|uniref:Uncharacterized protein n=1 Tax=Plasmopara halstedii TaxID=4781 RepID=A0A0P1ADK8_PLAHL|nr:uncharacterized protein PHALS_09071 [Plasmopara halstedii]CEG39006.1 hypothetical protein PHALS_09071 [Plasmopara halstedii]|eukprot:XP_024575375.1 hypothetical protein PHALS_09071 [Plasmopara halstedii]
MSKRDYFLQKGLQVQRLDEQISSTPTSGIASREVAKYRELCPPATPDSLIQKLIGQCQGDAQRMENVISELWEDYRGNDQDVWATVSKKNTKKKLEQSHISSQRSNSKIQHHENRGDVTQTGDTQHLRSSERLSTRGRGGIRGRGSVLSRGGRGGRGRGGAVVATGSTRGLRTDENEEESPENDTNSSNSIYDSQSSKTSKYSKSERGNKTTIKATTQSAAQVPPVVYPVLTGAWTKKLNVSKATIMSKPVEYNSTTTSAPEAATKALEKVIISAPETDGAVVKVAAEKAPSPKKKAQHETNKKTQIFSSSNVAEETTPADESLNAMEKVSSSKASPKKSLEKEVKSVETSVEATSSNIATGWGALDAASATMNKWSASVPVASTDSTKVSTSSTWARGSPTLSPPASKLVTPTPKSPVAETRPTVMPGSPKDIEAPRSTGSASTSPRPYLKMGKWDSAATPNLSLQFGSFSLNGVESYEPSSPVSWSSTTKTTATTTSNKGVKSITKSTTTQSGWGASTTPQKSLSPDHGDEPEHSQENTVAKTTASAPPGLSVDSGRETPTASQSPRYAPSAPSPASLPKPDEVKRNTPTRAQGSSFQTQGGASTQTNKMNIGYGTGLYQASYGTYSMDLGRSSANSTPSQLSAGGTPKTTSVRGGAVSQVAVQSPSLGQQPQMQQVSLQQQSQQQHQQHQQQPQQQGQQQTQQKLVQQQQSHQIQQIQQIQQNPAQQQPAAQMHQQAQVGMQQGYHYAPPPPPGMALPYNPYNYPGYYQGYGYYQNPQFTQYSPRTQYPPRGNMPYGVEGPVPGFSNPPNMPYQDQHMMAQQHEYAGASPQGFGEINTAYMQQASIQQQGGHLSHHGHQNGLQAHGKGGSGSVAISQQSHGQRGNANMQSYGNAGGRDHVTPPATMEGNQSVDGAT